VSAGFATSTPVTLGFSTAVALTPNRVGDRLLRIVDVAVGSGLIVFGILLGYRIVNEDAEQAAIKS
jgi:hypothetical protein